VERRKDVIGCCGERGEGGGRDPSLLIFKTVYAGVSILRKENDIQIAK
jgi:hypothetical protein